MKNILIVVLILTSLMACKTDTSKQNQGAETKATTTETKAEVKADTLHIHVFSCPMHPEITGKEGDKCPKCGMALEHRD